MSDVPPPPSPPLTFVCCIESGRLEEQTVLMLQTLRRSGGSLAEARVLAVVGRLGPALRAGTVAALEQLKVELIYDRHANPRPWFNYANKIAAVTIAQRLATTPLIAWLDSDILIAAEPAGLLLPDGIDFAGRCEFLPPAMHAKNPLHIPYWQALCTLAGIKVDDLPLITLDHPPIQMRLNFNSGVFTWRRDSDFAMHYRQLFIKLLDSRLAQHDGNFFTTDQVILAPLLIAHGLKWVHLDLPDHHMIFQEQLTGAGASPEMSAAKIIHYSKSLSLPCRPVFLKRLAAERPELYAFVKTQIDVEESAAAATPSVLGKSLKAYRGLRWKLYAARVRRAPRGTSPSP